MKTFFRHLLSLCLSGLVLFSTLSFTVDMHFCGKHLVDVGINERAEGCGMFMEQGSKAAPDANAATNMGCCRNVQVSVAGQDELQSGIFEVSLEYPCFLSQAAILPEVCVLPPVEEVAIYKGYVPPPRFSDLQVLHQIFLI